MKKTISGLMCAVFAAMCVGMQTTAEEAKATSGAEVMETLRAKVAGVDAWQGTFSTDYYHPETGEVYDRYNATFKAEGGSIEILWEEDGSSRYVVDAQGVLLSEGRYTGKNGVEREYASKTDLSEAEALFSKIPGLYVMHQEEWALAKPARFYAIFGDVYDWEILSQDTDAIVLRGEIKDAILARWQADPKIIEHKFLMSAMEMKADPESGLPITLMFYDKDGNPNHDYTFSNLLTGESVDPAAFEPIIGAKESVEVKDESEGYIERLSAMASGEYTAWSDKRFQKRMTLNYPTNVTLGDIVPAVVGPGLDGETIDLADMRGKVVLIDFWATWCGPCVKEMPHVLKEYELYRDQGFEVLGISLDDEAETVREWLEEHPEYTWPQICEETGRSESPLKQTFGVKAIPTTILVDRDGTMLAFNLREKWLAEKLAEVFGSLEQTD